MPGNPRFKAENQGKCWACGNSSHGPKNDKSTRSQKCPAWTTICVKCNFKGHFPKSCSKCSKCGAWGHRDGSSRFCKPQAETNGQSNGGQNRNRAFQTEDEGLFTDHDQLAVIQGDQNTIEHHVFDGKWIARPSKPHPTVLADQVVN